MNNAANAAASTDFVISQIVKYPKGTTNIPRVEQN